jgi:hypothetical protein
LSLIHFSLKCNYSILLHNKTPIYSAWGLLRVCAACPTPRLNQSYELRPPWEQHLRYVPHRVRNGYNKGPAAPSSPAPFIIRSVLCISHKAPSVTWTRLYIMLNHCRHLECSFVAVSEFFLGSEMLVAPGLGNRKFRPTFHASQILGVTTTDAGVMSVLFPGSLERWCYALIVGSNNSNCSCHHCICAFGFPHFPLN